MPSTKRHAKSPPKFLQAAWLQSATPHMNMLMLSAVRARTDTSSPLDIPHPFANWKTLKSKVLRILEDQIAQVENSAKPVIAVQDAETLQEMNANQLYLSDWNVIAMIDHVKKAGLGAH